MPAVDRTTTQVAQPELGAKDDEQDLDGFDEECRPNHLPQMKVTKKAGFGTSVQRFTGTSIQQRSRNGVGKLREFGTVQKKSILKIDTKPDS